MAQHGAGDGYPWDSYDSNPKQPNLASRVSSVSGVSSGEASRGSVVSLPSPNEESQSTDEIDISHVPLSSAVGSGVVSPIERHGQMSAMLPETLRVGNPPSQSIRSAFNPFRKPSVSYEPITDASSRQTGRTASKRFSTMKRGSFIAGRHRSIPEEDIDMSLLGSATPMGYSKQTTAGIDEVDEREHPILSPSADAAFDISSFAGPMTEAELRSANRQEAAGILTGGLGAGLKPDATLTSKDLLASTPTTPQSPTTFHLPLSPVSLTRRMTRTISGRGSGLARQPTLRDLGQIEANKRGEIIEVILEEEPAGQPESLEQTEQTEQAHDPSPEEEPFVDSK